MDANQENRYSALLKTQLYLFDNALAFSDVPQIGTQKLVIDGYIQGIAINNGIAINDTTGAAEAKADARLALTTSALRMARAAKSFALDIDDKLLLKSMNITKSELNTLRDTEVLHACNTILATTTPLIVTLAGYRVLPAHLTVLGTNLTTYSAAIPQPGKEIDVKVIARNNVVEFLQRAYQLLGTKMDSYVDLYMDDFPDLVEGYYLARAVDDMTGGGGGNGGGGNDDSLEFTGNVQPMTNGTAGPFDYDGATAVQVENLSPISFKLQLIVGGLPVGGQQTVQANGTLNTTLSTFATSGDSFRIVNDNPSIAISYKITLG